MDHQVVFISAETHQVNAAIWATGYRDRTDWVQITEVVNEQGQFVEERGISPMPVLFYIGRSWQTSRGSALVTGVGADAAVVTPHLLRTLDDAGRTGSPGQVQTTATAPVP